MTDRVALAMAVLIFAAIAADVALNGGVAVLFLLRKLEDLIIYVSFWR